MSPQFRMAFAGTALASAFTVSGLAAAQEMVEPTLLDTLVIYGARDATTLADSAASVGVVTADDIEAQQITDFRDAFRNLANVSDADWLDAGFVIRGVNSEGLVPGGAPLARAAE